MRRQSLGLFVTAIVFTLASAAPGQNDNPAKKSLADLQGTWKLTSLEREGEVREFADRAPRWVVKGDKVLYGGEELATLAPDAATTPKSLDLAFRTPKGDKEAIYSLTDDTWR